jgi:hypothetical protein
MRGWVCNLLVQLLLYICMYICAYMHSLFLQLLHTVWCLYKLYAHKNICKNNLSMFFNKETAQIGTNVRVHIFNAELLARSRFASEGPVTGQLHQGFWWVSLATEQMLSCYPNSMLHCKLHM